MTTARTIARGLITRDYLHALRQRVTARRDLWDRAMRGDAEALIALGRLVLDQGTDDEDDTGTAATRRRKGTTNE